MLIDGPGGRQERVAVEHYSAQEGPLVSFQKL